MSTRPSEPSAKRDLIIAYIEDHPKAMMLMRLARTHAERTGGKWRAIFVETPSHPGPREGGSQERLLRLLTIAKQMGGEVAHVEAESIEKGLSQLIDGEKERLALIILGSGEGSYGLRFGRTPRDYVLRLAQRYDIPVEEAPPLSGHSYRRNWRERLHWIRPLHILYALMSVGVACMGAWALQGFLPPALFRINNQNVGLLFMTACAFSASRFGLLPGLIASAASSLIINYFFTSPFHTFSLNVTDLLNLMIFLSGALLISLFTSHARGFAEKAAKRELGTQALFTLYRIAAGADSRQQALEKLQDKLTRMLQMEIAFFLPTALNSTRIEASYPADLSLDEASRKALDVCWKDMKTTGLASSFNPGTRWRFEPMLAPGGEIGVLGVRPRERQQLDAWFGRLLTAIADQTASVIEHIELEYSMEMSRLSAEREKLRSMLLSSVSHDLKTPLASISGALTIYRTHGKKLDTEKREALIEMALEETERLSSFITNILDMTRLESGKLGFKQDWYDSQTFISDVLGRLNHRLRSRNIITHPGPQKTEVFMDLMMTEQVLQNILDNACKYTPAGTAIEIRCGTDEAKGFFCEVRDFGQGLPPEKLDRVFDKYARLQMQDSQIAGTGLGLAICKAVMEAQHGHVTAGNHPDGGAIFTFWLPKWRSAQPSKKYAA